MTEISESALEEIHDLIDKINRNVGIVEVDTRNLNNLVHVVMGEGIRFPEYRKEGNDNGS